MTTAVRPFRELVRQDDGTDELVLNFHEGQSRAWESKKRWIFMQCGPQSGKTVLGPPWLEREIRNTGSLGDYLAVSATFPLLNKKMVPEFRTVFEHLLHLGVWKAADMEFNSHERHHGAPAWRVIFGSATNPESLESATAKAAWLDELAQRQFSREAWEAVLRRLSLAMGRILGTSTLYEWGWYKTEIYDRWRAGAPHIEIIRFDSLVNPAFPREEYERARSSMPSWKFDLFYRGLFEKPAGLIYDAFDATVCRIPRPWNKPPERYIGYVGHDFGPDNTAALWCAQDPDTGFLYFHREYHAGGLSSAQHAAKFIELSAGELIVRRTGGGPTNEDGYRDAYTAAGWPIGKPAIRGVEAGIDRVYGWFKQNRIFIFDDLTETLDELTAYSRELDTHYQPIPNTIADKARFHKMDCLRYMMGEFAPEMVEVGRVTQVYTPSREGENVRFG